MSGKQFVLVVKPGCFEVRGDRPDSYYTGKSFTYLKARYARVSKDLDDAKIYTSKKKAEKALKIDFENYEFKVEALDEPSDEEVVGMGVYDESC
jgi:hypothetical protein